MLAGFILNFMPCVLPVIGLKLLSFLEQGGKNPGRVLMLNVWYTLGILSAYPLPSQEQTTCSGNSRCSSVCRLARPS
jgi:hypothetical protein